MERQVATSAKQKPTYIDVGATIAGHRPDGYRHDLYETEIGHGNADFERAVTGLRGWRAHDLPGVGVFPEALVVRPGATVIVTLGLRVMSLAAPCRIVGTIDEPNRWGFAYGTLPGHPEQGEECFVVSIAEAHIVRFTITAFSRPGGALTRFAGPVGRAVQKKGTESYLGALRRFVEEDT
jgi:uncharacterized protein (UPF0548 family)